jgi:manganese transport protein
LCQEAVARSTRCPRRSPRRDVPLQRWSVLRSWLQSPISIRETSQRTSRPVPASAAPLCGWSSSPTLWRCSCSTCPHLSAKLGIATGRDLPELCRQHLPRAVSLGLWVQAEIVAMATDLAEFVGAATGLDLLFRVPLPIAGAVTAMASFTVLALEQRGRRPFELAIAALFVVVFFGFAYNLASVHVDLRGVASGLRPGFPGSDGVQLAVGIVGATVMPHVIYLHSALTKTRRDDAASRGDMLRAQRVDVVVALGTAGLVNIAMLVLAAALLHGLELGGADPIVSAHTELSRCVGGAAALAFGVALLASGLSSSTVGTYAGQVVMLGFVQRALPVTVRRAITMAPALAVLVLRLPATDSLVLSQVVLSFGTPFALVPLVLLTRRADVMGVFVNRRVTTFAAAGCAALVIALNCWLLIGTLK